MIWLNLWLCGLVIIVLFCVGLRVLLCCGIWYLVFGFRYFGCWRGILVYLALWFWGVWIFCCSWFDCYGFGLSALDFWFVGSVLLLLDVALGFWWF